MGALYWRAPTAAELAELGLKAKHYPPPKVTLWPECLAPIQLFSRVSTQWRAGAGGPFGLDYNVVDRELQRAGVSGENYDEMMAAIRVIESAALDCIRQS